MLELVDKWEGVLDIGNPILDAKIRENTAIVLENTQNNIQGTPYEIATLTVPTLRRIFPTFLAHKVMDVEAILDHEITIDHEANIAYTLTNILTKDKLGTRWSTELVEDMKSTLFGINVDEEMIGLVSHEIKSEMDLRVLGELVKKAVCNDNSGSTNIDDVYSTLESSCSELDIDYIIIDEIALAHLGDLVIKPIWYEMGISDLGTVRIGDKDITIYYSSKSNSSGYMYLGNSLKSGLVYRPYLPVDLKIEDKYYQVYNHYVIEDTDNDYVGYFYHIDMIGLN